MADHKTFSRYNMRCGLVLRAEEGGRKLEGFDIPELDPRFLVLTAEDFSGRNEINILGTTMPLLASSYIAYKGQPLLVLFGPDYESTELAIEKIVVRTSEVEEENREESELPDPLFFSWGLDEAPEEEKSYDQMEKIESQYEVKLGELPSFVRYTVLSWKDGSGTFHIQCPTQWPQMLKENVADALDISLEHITLHAEKYNAKYDEYLVGPAFQAVFTTMGAERTGLACEMREEGEALCTGISFHTTTWLDNKRKPRHEEVSVTVNQGAFAIGGKEVQRQIMVGILPHYPLESFKAMIRTERSANPPRAFSGHKIYASAFSSRNLHSTKLASKLELTPYSFAVENTKEATKFTDWAPKHDLSDTVDKIKKVGDISDFNRKWASTALHAGRFGLQGYLYGIGLSSGLSIAGFSTTMAKSYQFMSQVAYTAKKNVAISGAIPSSISQDRNVRDALSYVFSQDEKGETVIFLDNAQKALDSGPDILSSYSSDYLSQLMKGTAKLSQLVKQEDTVPPVVLKFNAQNQSFPCDFEYSGFGAAVAEIKIPKVSLLPEVKSLCLDCALALPYKKGVKDKIKRTALLSLQSLGIRCSSDFSIKVSLSSERKEISSYSSLENMVESLVSSSVTAALWQAVGNPSVMTLPMNAEDVEKLTGGKDTL